MAKEVVMPKLGAEMTTGRILEWKKGEGEWVEEKAVLVVIETDKITYEVESPVSGYLHILKAVDEEVPIAVAMAVLCETEKELEGLVEEGLEHEPGPAVAEASDAVKEPRKGEASLREEISPVAGLRRPDIRISPLARKMAREAGLDITTVKGTGTSGRIKKRDVVRMLETRQLVPAYAPGPQPAVFCPSVSEKTVREVVAIRGAQKVIAERLCKSL